MRPANPWSSPRRPRRHPADHPSLVELGADPNAVDKNGTTPLHRAVRNRCAAAVQALLDLGADPQSALLTGFWKDPGMEDEVRLPEGRSGNRVWRMRDQVLRESGPWTPTVHAFLGHLERSGFVGAPRVLGIAPDGREILSYLDGEVLGGGPDWRPGQPTRWPQFARSEECLVQSAALLRRLHDASASFVPPADAIWRQHECSALGVGEIVCHGDVGPHNTVYRDGGPVAFIDFDSIRPNHPLIEFGNAAWRFVPLGDDAYFEVSEFPATPDLLARLSLFARAYGVSDPDDVLWSLHQAKQRTVEAARFWPISAGEGAVVLRQVASDLEWLDQNADRLIEGLVGRSGA